MDVGLKGERGLVKRVLIGRDNDDSYGRPLKMNLIIISLARFLCFEPPLFYRLYAFPCLHVGYTLCVFVCLKVLPQLSNF